MINLKRGQTPDSAAFTFVKVMLLALAILIAPTALAQDEQADGKPQNILPQQKDLEISTDPTESEALNEDEVIQDEEDIPEYNYTNASFFGDQEYEDLIFAVFIEKRILSPGIFAVQKDGRYYLPIEALSEIFTFNAEANSDKTVVSGWSVSPEKNYEINTLENYISYRSETAALPEGSVLDSAIANDDVYVWSEVLEQIWPVSLNIDLGALLLRVVPDEALPFEKLLERKTRQKNLLDNQLKRAEEEGKTLPFLAKPYKLFGQPSWDFETRLGYDARRNGAEYRFNFNGVQDLAYASADYSVSLGSVAGEFDRPENFRLRFRRQDIHERALPLGLEDVQWGDVRLANRDLISNGIGGRGAIFTTRENIFENEFDQITVDGIAIAGWETELYINEQLIDFGVVDERGEYRFENVSVGYGNNKIKVVLYGPQGQIEERKENYFYQSRMVRAGENEFSGGIVDGRRDLIEIEEREDNLPRGKAANIYGARGISDKLTVFASANTLKHRDSNREDVTRRYVTAGAIGTVAGTLGQLEFYKQLDDGHAVDVRTLSDFKGFKLNTRVSKFSDFESPTANNDTLAKNLEIDVNVRKSFQTFLGSLGLEAGADYLERKNGTEITGYRTRQSLGLKKTRITHTTRSILTDSDHTSTTGRLSSSSRFKNWSFRNSLNYRFFPKKELSSLQTEVRFGRNKNSTAFRLQRNVPIDETIAGVQISRDFKKFLGSLEADWSSIHGFSVMARASASIGPYNPDGSYLMQSDPLRTAGPISSFVFLDKDYDGVYDANDEPVPDTRITIGRRVIREETDENGYIAEINRTSVGRPVKVTVSQKSIDDPYLVPAVDGYSVHPRPGAIHALSFPLIDTGAIDGTLRLSNGEAVSGEDVELVDSSSNIIQKSRTALDGYFTFERIPPGEYRIRTAEDSTIKVKEQNVSLTTDNLFQFGVDVEADDSITADGSQALTIKNILSIARNIKNGGSKGILKTASASPQAPMVVKNIHGTSVVEGIRLGKHPGKVRVVLDLSRPTNYTINHDKTTGIVSVQLPQAAWGTSTTWRGKSGSLVNNYSVQGMAETGNILNLQVASGARIGDSGLLKAHRGKKDRLYIDIQRN